MKLEIRSVCNAHIDEVGEFWKKIIRDDILTKFPDFSRFSRVLRTMLICISLSSSELKFHPSELENSKVEQRAGLGRIR